jgi:hypothetical protein
MTKPDLDEWLEQANVVVHLGPREARRLAALLRQVVSGLGSQTGHDVTLANHLRAAADLEAKAEQRST